MTNLRAKSAFWLGTVFKSVFSGPNESFLQIDSTIFLSVFKSGSCQCGSFFNLDPLKRGGQLSEIDEFEREKRKQGVVKTLLKTPEAGERGSRLWKRDSGGGIINISHGKRDVSETRTASGILCNTRTVRDFERR